MSDTASPPAESRALAGRVAVVTGAARGIGRTYALALAAAGATVVCADLDEAGAAQTVGLIEDEGGTGSAVAVDVSDQVSTRALADHVHTEHGTAHVLVNNAAIFDSIRIDPQLTIDVDYWRKVFQVNVDGALLVTQAVAPMMIEAGWGRIVNQSSISAYSGRGGLYSTTKLALIGVTHGFAKELAPHGITVNALAPGPIATDAMLRTATPAILERLQGQMLIKREAQPSDLIGALLFLVSEGASWVTGQTLVVDGGSTVRI